MAGKIVWVVKRTHSSFCSFMPLPSLSLNIKSVECFPFTCRVPPYSMIMFQNPAEMKPGENIRTTVGKRWKCLSLTVATTILVDLSVLAMHIYCSAGITDLEFWLIHL